MNKPTKLVNKPRKPIDSTKPRCVRVAALLSAAATLAAAVLIGTGGPKLPPLHGD